MRDVVRCSVFVAFAALAHAPAFGGQIAGRVVDGAGKPIANARVIAAENTVARILFASPEGAFAISPSESDPLLAAKGKLTGEARTDADGRFKLGDLRPARYSLMSIDSSGGFALRADAKTDDSAEIVLTSTPGAFIEGRLSGIQRDSTRHVFELKPQRPTGNVTMTPNVKWLDGDRFRFGPLPDAGDWNVVLTDWVQERAFRATLATQPVHCTSGATSKADIDLAAGESIAGRVTGADGKPLTNVSIVARSKTEPMQERGTLTDERGQYVIRGLARGAWSLEARRWTIRATPGCGVGPKDLHALRDVSVPLEDKTLADLVVQKSLATLRVGDTAPDFVAKTFDDKTVALSDLRGKVVLVDFWASWCGMCRAEFPRLRETYALFNGGKEFEIVGASIDEDADAARRVCTSLKLAWPQTALGPVETNALAQIYNIAATPSSFLIDRDGKIVAVNVMGEELRAELSKLVKRAN